MHIYLLEGKRVSVDDEDSYLLVDYLWHLVNGVYVQCSKPIKGERLLHRIIMQPPCGMEVDHKDLNPLNNVRDNLQILTPSQNKAKRGVFSNSSTGVKGITPKGDKYQARITVHGEQIYLGTRDTAEEAHQLYLSARQQYFQV